MEEDRAADALAVVGDRGVGLSHLQRCHTHEQAAEPDCRLALVDRREDAEAVCDVGNGGGLDQHRQLGEDRVVGHRHGLGQLQVLAVLCLAVGDVPELAAAEVEQLLGRGERRRGADALLEGGQIDERLERGAGLAVRIGRDVELVPHGVRLAAGHRQHLAAARINRHDRGLRHALALQAILERLLGQLLLMQVEGGDDLHAATEGLRGSEAVDELLGDELGPVGVVRIQRLRLNAIDGEQTTALLNGSRIGVDEALRGHRLEDDVAARERGLGVVDGVVRGGRLEDRGEQRRVGRVEVPGGGAEVVLGGALDAVGVVTEVDRVEVRREDAVLRPALLELPGQGGLAHLALDGLRAGQVRVLDELLGDRAGALVGAGGEAVEDGAADAGQVNAVVRVEALVLDGDHGVLHHLRDALAGDDHPRLVGAEDCDAPGRAGLARDPDGPVLREARGAPVELAEIRQVGADRGDEAVRRGGGEDQADEDRDDADAEPAPASTSGVVNGSGLVREFEDEASVAAEDRFASGHGTEEPEEGSCQWYPALARPARVFSCTA